MIVRYYESVMAAKHVQIDAIPLPNMSTGKKGWSSLLLIMVLGQIHK